MGAICSYVEQIDDLWFYPIPTNRIITGKVAMVDGVVIVISNKGKLYSNCIGKNISYLPAIWPWTDAAMRALVRLKVISQSVADEHIRRCEQRDMHRSAEHALKYHVKELERLGVRLPQEQVERLRAMSEGLPV